MWRGKFVHTSCRAKATVAALLTLCFFARTMPVSADDVAYRMAKVTRGTMTAEVNVQIEYEYTGQVPIKVYSACGSVTFMGYAVELGSYVQKGDPIANIATDVDEITLEEIRLRLQRAEQSRDKAYADMQERYAAAKRAVEESSGTQKQIAKLRLEQLEMEQEKNRRRLDEEVAGIQEKLGAYEEAVGVTQIFAPESGILINTLNNYRPGITLWNGTQLGVIESVEEPMFTMKDPSGVMRYGMSVSILDWEGHKYEAKIVSCGEKYLSGAFETKRAHLKPDSGSAWGFNAVYDNLQIDNVLLVDTAAVQRDKDGTYVVELKDGKLSKCYFTVGKTVNDLCYAIDGLTEGMTVIIQ